MVQQQWDAGIITLCGAEHKGLWPTVLMARLAKGTAACMFHPD